MESDKIILCAAIAIKYIRKACFSIALQTFKLYICAILKRKIVTFMETFVQKIFQKVKAEKPISFKEALRLTKENKADLYAAAERLTKYFGGAAFDTCSIVNARSGKCSENCKWCAQSGYYHTDISTYPIIDRDFCVKQAVYSEAKGVKRFSLVTSGRSVAGTALKQVTDIYRDVRGRTDLFLCASMGLLTKEALKALYDAGVRRYHCNLEAAPSYFHKLCTTHTIDEKIQTLRYARELGFEICSGGIIGMGETEEQRVELAFKLLEVKPDSIPINILQPIKGTPLENVKPLSDDEILTTVAVFRFVHPKAELRFAGGRARLSGAVKIQAMKIGINSAVVGDLLTTTGSKIEDDRILIKKSGYRADSLDSAASGPQKKEKNKL